MRYVRVHNPVAFDELYRDAVGEVVEDVPRRYLIVRVDHPQVVGVKTDLRLRHDQCETISPQEYFKARLHG